MTEIRKTLLKLVEEYRQSLDRVQGEKELMKCIEARAVTECGIAISRSRWWRPRAGGIRPNRSVRTWMSRWPRLNWCAAKTRTPHERPPDGIDLRDGRDARIMAALDAPVPAATSPR